MKGTIKSKKDVERLFQMGRRSSSYVSVVLAVETEGEGRCAFIAGKKLGIAPYRSRCKRVLRSCVKDLGGPWDGYDVAFVARPKVAYASHGKVLKQLRRQLDELGVTNE